MESSSPFSPLFFLIEKYQLSLEMQNGTAINQRCDNCNFNVNVFYELRTFSLLLVNFSSHLLSPGLLHLK